MSKTKIVFFCELMEHTEIKIKFHLLFSSFYPLLEPGHEKQAVEGSRFRYCDDCEILSEDFGKTQNDLKNYAKTD